jgi:hypothetical protein
VHTTPSRGWAVGLLDLGTGCPLQLTSGFARVQVDCPAHAQSTPNFASVVSRSGFFDQWVVGWPGLIILVLVVLGASDRLVLVR